MCLRQEYRSSANGSNTVVVAKRKLLHIPFKPWQEYPDIIMVSLLIMFRLYYICQGVMYDAEGSGVDVAADSIIIIA